MWDKDDICFYVKKNYIKLIEVLLKGLNGLKLVFKVVMFCFSGECFLDDVWIV